MSLPSVMQHTSCVNAVSSHTLHSISSVIISVSLILSCSFCKDCGSGETINFVLDTALENKTSGCEVGWPWWDRIRDMVMSVEGFPCRIWDKIAFRGGVCCFTHGNRIEPLEWCATVIEQFILNVTLIHSHGVCKLNINFCLFLVLQLRCTWQMTLGYVKFR
jgi:hypothetical protein